MTLLSPRREVGEFRKRYKWMATAVICAFGLIAARLVQLQVVNFDAYSAAAQENITKTIILPAPRGLVRDAQGRVVADNRPSYDLFLTPQLVRDEDLRRLARLLGLSSAEEASLRQRLVNIPPRRRSHQVEILSDITRDQLAAVETHAASLPGVDVVARAMRTYPYGSLGAHAIGYLNEINADELNTLDRKRYRSGDLVGRTGIERALEQVLRGESGFRRVRVDARGRVQDAWQQGTEPVETTRNPLPGHSVTLTLDMALMRAIDRAFRGHPSGAAVVVEANTGRVRALYSKPSYDLNEMSGQLTHDRFTELTQDPFRPLIDKTVYESYFPGSIVKPISALAALEQGSLEPSTRVECIGYYELGNRRFRCTHAHGEVDLVGALVQSCNVYFYRLGELVGLDRLAEAARDFGLGSPTGLGINSETSGTITTKEWYEKHYGSRYRLGFTLNAAIGQGNTRATLLQLAAAYGALVNGGRLFRPQLIEQVETPDGAVVDKFRPQMRHRLDADPEHLRLLVQGLRGVVNDPLGTAFEARREEGVVIGGKTGTAQVPRHRPQEGESPHQTWYLNRDHAWFAGFAPADDPELVAVVLVEHGGAGGKTAAPVAIQILNEGIAKHETADAGSKAGVLARVVEERGGGG